MSSDSCIYFTIRCQSVRQGRKSKCNKLIDAIPAVFEEELKYVLNTRDKCVIITFLIEQFASFCTVMYSFTSHVFFLKSSWL